VSFLIAFAFLWVGSGIAVGSIVSISRSLRISSFLVSFFMLGVFTSITEIMVGINAFIEGSPEIFVGNLIGSSAVIFVFIIPIVAILGNGVSLNHSFSFKDLVSAILVVGMPALLTLDNRVGTIDALICIVMYVYFAFLMNQKSSSLDKISHINIRQSTLLINILKIVVAIILVFAGSNILVEQTEMAGKFFGISPFVVSVLLVSLGTNIPETSIAIRSLFVKRKDIAFGNYVGSAAFNSLELGILSFLYKSPVPADGSNYSVIVFLVGLILFLYFVKSRNTISRQEGSILLLMYLLFVAFELLTGPGWKLI
jgi:cation:H+ antiporter